MVGASRVLLEPGTAPVAPPLKQEPRSSDDWGMSDMAPSLFRRHELAEVVWSIGGRSSVSG